MNSIRLWLKSMYPTLASTFSATDKAPDESFPRAWHPRSLVGFSQNRLVASSRRLGSGPVRVQYNESAYSSDRGLTLTLFPFQSLPIITRYVGSAP